MNTVIFGLLSGTGFGIFAVLLMLPMDFPNKTTALIAAFASRFAIGFLIPQVHLPLSAIVTGALVGLLISLPDALVTKAYAPILGVGVLGGAVIGWLTDYFVA